MVTLNIWPVLPLVMKVILTYRMNCFLWVAGTNGEAFMAKA